MLQDSHYIPIFIGGSTRITTHTKWCEITRERKRENKVDLPRKNECFADSREPREKPWQENTHARNGILSRRDRCHSVSVQRTVDGLCKLLRHMRLNWIQTRTNTKETKRDDVDVVFIRAYGERNENRENKHGFDGCRIRCRLSYWVKHRKRTDVRQTAFVRSYLICYKTEKKRIYIEFYIWNSLCTVNVC